LALIYVRECKDYFIQKKKKKQKKKKPWHYYLTSCKPENTAVLYKRNIKILIKQEKLHYYFIILHYINV
jgi:hypothetical protein